MPTPPALTDLVIYREGTKKGPIALRTDFRALRLSLRSGLGSVNLRIDDGPSNRLKLFKPVTLTCDKGEHTLRVSAPHMETATLKVEVLPDLNALVVVSPRPIEGCGVGSALGRFEIWEAENPSELEPYAFYRSLPSSGERGGVLASVLTSAVASGIFFMVPPIFAMGCLARGWGVLAVAGVLLAPLAGFCMPFGALGLLAAYRFWRLPADWRNPTSS